MNNMTTSKEKFAFKTLKRIKEEIALLKEPKQKKYQYTIYSSRNLGGWLKKAAKAAESKFNQLFFWVLEFHIEDLESKEKRFDLVGLEENRSDSNPRIIIEGGKSNTGIGRLFQAFLAYPNASIGRFRFSNCYDSSTYEGLEIIDIESLLINRLKTNDKLRDKLNFIMNTINK